MSVVCASVPAELQEYLDRLAKKDVRSRSNIISLILEEWVAQHKRGEVTI